MKQFFLMTLVIVATAQITYAKSGAECKADLVSVTHMTNGKYLLEQKDGVPEIADCKNIQFNNGTQLVNNKVYLTADKSSLVIQNNATSTLSFSMIPGLVTDYAVMAGRLIISTADNKVLVVGRNGNVFEMLTSAGKSYADVKSIAIKDGVLVMDQNKNAAISLTEEQVTKRINEAGKFRAISF